MRAASTSLVCLFAIAVAACSAAPQNLSETGLYDDIVTGGVTSSALPFEPRYPLWSDGAEKQRWALLPDDGVIDSRDMDAWVFPDGTRFFKEFSRDGRRVETRVLGKDNGGSSPCPS